MSNLFTYTIIYSLVFIVCILTTIIATYLYNKSVTETKNLDTESFEYKATKEIYKSSMFAVISFGVVLVSILMLILDEI